MNDPIRDLEDFAARGLSAQKAVDALTKPKRARVNSTPLLNRKAVRDWLLTLARKNRAHRYTRVSEQTLAMLNQRVKIACLEHVARMPSAGKTL